MNTPLQTYLLAQGELGGFDVVLSSPLLSEPRCPRLKDLQDFNPEPQIPALAKPVSQDDSLWKNTGSIDDFYKALQKHSVYTKSMRALNFYVPNKINIKAPLLLLFHSPTEFTAEAKEILERLFKKLDIDLNGCAISFFFKCNETVYSREKPILREMLNKEIELLNPEKIIFFREAPRPETTEAPAKISDKPVLFAGKPLITLYSLLEMLGGKPNFKEKMTEVLNICRAQLLSQP